MANEIKLGSLNISAFKVGSGDCTIYLGGTLLYPSFQGKWLARYTGGTTSSADCDSTSAVTQNEIIHTDLASVKIGNCVTTIGNAAFNGYTSLTSVTIPNSVTTIGIEAFKECTSLTSVTIPRSATSLGDDAFLYCTALTSITIPNSVTTIGSNAFFGCSGLTSVTIGTGVTSISTQAFRHCHSLTSITIPNSVTIIESNAFRNCTGLASITIPNSVTRIDVNAFRDCSGLTSCTIGSGVTEIGNYAFRNCSGLTAIIVEATTPPTLGSSAFDSTNDCPIYVPAGSVNAYKSASGWSDYASRIQAITNSFVATYSTGATYSELCGSYSTLTSATTKPSGYDYTDMVSAEVGICITNIDATAFNGMSSLSAITFDSTVPPTIASGAFDNTDAMLYVPCSSVGTYRAASNWSDYTNRIVGYESCTTYSWETISGEYICQTGDKYEKQKKIRSFDGGTTWEDVIPYIYQAGQLIESGSTDCQYIQYEYIRTENSSESYYKFDTGFYPTTANTIEIKMEMVDTSVDWGAIIGWASCDGDYCDSTQFRFTTVTGQYCIIARKGSTDGIELYSVGANTPITVTLPLSASTYTYYDGILTYTCNYNMGSFSLPSSTPLNIFSFGYNKPAAVAKIYYVKVYDTNNNLVKHYIPSDDNGTPCFYEVVDGDKVLDTYTGANHGTLTLGPVVN